MYFKGVGLPDNKMHEVTMKFLKKIVPDKVAIKNNHRNIEYIIQKENKTEEYWPTLTNDKKRPHWLKVDFNKWKDEGSEDEGGGE
jgi:cytosolic prostaglandin-E synthase